jgi:formate dehydrogenase major subunit
MKLKINGRTIEAKAGQTILDAARRAGIFIPTLCHDEKLEPYASCWLCAVRVTGEKRLKPACATLASDGMEVVTADEEILATRRLCVELLLSDHCGECIPPCQVACPAGCDARDYIYLILNKRYSDALRLIMETVPMPATIGRICPHPCEEECRRGVVDEPASICALKRFAAERGWGAVALPKKDRQSGKRVAVVGSGPAGLTAAYFLSLRGHAVTIFESRDKPGGMLRYGIPEYRLPKNVLDREIEVVRKLGAEIRCGEPVGAALTIPALLAQGFHAVLIAVGAQLNRRMGIEGEEVEGVLGGIEFLADVASGGRPQLGQFVIVVGGGDTAIDAARTSLRLGAKHVAIVYRRSREEMPASGAEIKAAEEEGVELRYLTLPLKISRHDGGLRITCSRMALAEPDESGRRRPVAVPGSEHAIACDSIIMAIGQSVDPSVLTSSDIQAAAGGRINAHELMHHTDREAVFAAGDCVTGPDIAISAVAAGRRAAHAIDSFLRTGKPEPLIHAFSPVRRSREDVAPAEYAGEEKMPRALAQELEPQKRIQGFPEAERTIDEEDALREAYRCLECGCEKAVDCTMRDLAMEYGIHVNRFGSPGKRAQVDDRHPHIVRDPDKCIKCARCIRVCLEVQGIGAWGYTGRGFDMQVAPPFGLPLQDAACESCGQCLITCPTGALIERKSLPRCLDVFTEATETTCGHCGDACHVILHTAGGRVANVMPRENGNLCERGKFGFAYLGGRNRIVVPLTRKGRRMAQAGWDEIAALVRERIKGIAPRAIAIFISPRCTNEEAYEAQKIARTVIRTNNIYPATGRAFSALLQKRFGRIVSPCHIEEVGESDAIILIDPLIVKRNAVAALSIIRAARRGARFLIVGGAGTKLDRFSSKKLRVDPDHPESYLGEIDSFARGARRPTLIYNRDFLSDEAILALHRFAGTMKARIVSLCAEINGQGLLDAGVSPFVLPGQKLVTNQATRKELEGAWESILPAWKGLGYDKMISTMRQGRIQAALFLGGYLPDDKRLAEALGKVPFVAMQAIVPSRLTRLAHLLLPAASWAETTGTITRYDGRKLKLRKALPPLCGYSNLEIWRRLFSARRGG